MHHGAKHHVERHILVLTAISHRQLDRMAAWCMRHVLGQPLYQQGHFESAIALRQRRRCPLYPPMRTILQRSSASRSLCLPSIWLPNGPTGPFEVHESFNQSDLNPEARVCGTKHQRRLRYRNDPKLRVEYPDPAVRPITKRTRDEFERKVLLRIVSPYSDGVVIIKAVRPILATFNDKGNTDISL